MAPTTKQNKQNNKQKPQAGKKDIPNNNKMTDKKQKKPKKSNGGSRTSCWVFGSLLLFGGIASLIAYDTHALHNGVFEESNLGRVLKQTGALPHVEDAWFISLKYSARGFKWLEENAPTAYNKSITFLCPYGEFAKDLGITLLNGGIKGWECTKTFASEKIPLTLEFIDKYVPGLGQKIGDFTTNACKGVCNITCNVWRHSVDFFKQKIFVGSLSPENIGKALNVTTERALGYYGWFHEKVDFYAKIK